MPYLRFDKEADTYKIQRSNFENPLTQAEEVWIFAFKSFPKKCIS